MPLLLPYKNKVINMLYRSFLKYIFTSKSIDEHLQQLANLSFLYTSLDVYNQLPDISILIYIHSINKTMQYTIIIHKIEWLLCYNIPSIIKVYSLYLLSITLLFHHMSFQIFALIKYDSSILSLDR